MPMNALMGWALAAVALSACGGSGNVRFNTWGGPSIESGIPTDSAAKAGFVDGWSVKYSKFYVVLKDITVRDLNNAVAFKQSNPMLFNLASPGPFEVETAKQLTAEKYSQVSYAIGTTPTAVPGTGSGVTAADVIFMQERGYGIYVTGTANKVPTATSGAISKTFEWGFNLDTAYVDCSSAEFGGPGVNVPTGVTETVELTVHGDRLFHDDLQAPDAKLRFDALASADKSPQDGKITLEELAATQLTGLAPAAYGTSGNSSVKTLKDFVFALSRTIGHYRGVGECTTTAR